MEKKKAYIKKLPTQLWMKYKFSGLLKIKDFIGVGSGNYK